MNADEQKLPSTKVKFREFLETVPSHSVVELDVKPSEYLRLANGNLAVQVAVPPIKHFCPSSECSKNMTFALTESDDDDFGTVTLPVDEAEERVLVLVCKHCSESTKRIAVAFHFIHAGEHTTAFKIGEHPNPLPPTPRKLNEALGAHKATFLKGRHCELLGYGLGASVYYRRIVEELKDTLIDQITRVVESENPSDPNLEPLRAAKGQWKFTQAIDDISHLIPKSLFLKGHNPLKLLHNALSEDIHNGNDEQILANARHIREILGATFTRLSELVRDDAVPGEAIKALSSKKNATAPQAKPPK